MKKINALINLFLTFFKIGICTFGGGYAMIAIIEREAIERKKWLKHEEFLDIIAIAESTPGPLAINSATFIGYKIAGAIGSIFATLGVVIPSFIIIYAISLFFDAFLSIEWVGYAFLGIQSAVAFLILNAGIKMFKSIEKSPLSIVLFILSVGCLVVFSLFAIKFSTIFYILIGGFVGVLAYLISLAKNKKNNANKSNLDEGEDK